MSLLCARTGAVLAATFFSLIFTAQATAGAALPSPLDIPWTDRTLFRSGLVESAQGLVDELPGATVYHLEIEIADDLAAYSGRVETLYTNQEDVPLSEVYFRLYPNAAGGHTEIRSLVVDGTDIDPVLELDGLNLCVPLSSPLAPGAAVEIEIAFEATVPSRTGARYGLFSSYEGILSLDEGFPTIPIHDASGWHLEPVLPGGDVAVYDASFHLLRVSTPAGLTVVGSGIEVGREEVDGRQILLFAAGPVRNVYLAVTEGLTTVRRIVGQTTIRSVAFPDDLPAAERLLDHAQAALESFGRRFSSYPYTELDFVVSALLYGGSAMEYAGAVVLSRPLYDPSAIIWGYVPSPVALETCVAHETAHQWFFNQVGNDQVNEPWLDEALAQYATSLYYEDVHGPQAAQSYRKDWFRNWGRAEGAEIPIGLPVGAYAPSFYGPIVYGRGPLFVFDLAITLGQEPFDAFLQDYVKTFAWGIATTESFRALAETHCGCDLGPSFEAWVYPQE